MRIIKRNGAEENFNEEKILVAITKANESVEPDVRMTELQIKRITESVVIACEALGRAPTVEEIQDLVERKIMAHGAFEVAKSYITYGIAFLFLAGCIWLSKIPVKSIVRGMKPLVMILVFTGVLNIFFTAGDPVPPTSIVNAESVKYPL